ncbi:MAG: CPBP family intramembrane metalloprotease [Planctomycetes bacterium]|nr:CPBP family intramembrane metalloprotease [Planctomycetota bacterium]
MNPAARATQAGWFLLSGFALLVLMAVDWRLAAVMAVAMVMVLPPAPWRPAAPRRVLLVYGIWLLAWLAFTVTWLRAMAALGHAVEPQEVLRELAEQGVDLPGLALRLLLIVVAAPLVEEVVFRGYLFAAVERLAPPWLTQLVVATLFGLAHGLDHAVPIGFLSLGFGYLRQRHGSLLPSMLAHALHNALMVGLIVQWPGLLDLLYAR